MKLCITMGEKPFRIVSSDCKTLEDVAELVFFFMKNCKIVSVFAEG